MYANVTEKTLELVYRKPPAQIQEFKSLGVPSSIFLKQFPIDKVLPKKASLQEQEVEEEVDLNPTEDDRDAKKRKI